MRATLRSNNVAVAKWPALKVAKNWTPSGVTTQLGLHYCRALSGLGGK